MPDCDVKDPNIKEKILNPTDTFTASCGDCQNCCRNQGSFRFILSGFDIYRITKTIKMKPINFISNYCVMCYGDKTNLPFVYLKTRDDGSCCLFQKGKCKAKEDKPTACAMYPIGRYYDAVDDRFYYYRTEMCDRDENGDKWVLEDWLEVNGIFETEEISLAWCHALTNIVKETSRLDHDRLPNYEFLYTVINGTMYYNYYNQEPYFKEPYIKKFRDQMDGLEYFLETYWRKYN